MVKDLCWTSCKQNSERKKRKTNEYAKDLYHFVEVIMKSNFSFAVKVIIKISLCYIY